MRKPASTTAPRWPFWLLIVAWVCANSPQVATYAVLTWLAEARQFSHQQQLTRDVAHLLSGEKAPARQATVVAASEQDDANASRPAVPAASVLKKIDLSTEKWGEHVRRLLADVSFEATPDRRGEALRAPPPHGPPRAEAAT